jgi:hypothetical protein
MRVKTEKIEGTYDPENRSGKGRHLGSKGKAKLVEYILQGYSNRQINLLLVQDRVLIEGDSISHATFARYRKLPEAQFDAAKLTDEAVAVGMTKVSQIIVGQAEIWDRVFGEIMNSDIDDIAASRLAAYATLLKNAAETILGVFAPDLSDRVKEHIERLRQQAKEATAERNDTRQHLAHVVSLISRHLKGEISRDQAEVMIGEFAVNTNPQGETQQ